MSWRWFVAAGLVCPCAVLSGQTRTMSQGSNRMELILEKKDGQAWKAVDPGTVFEQNDYVRFRFKTNFPGHLYVMNQGTSGDYTLLFPREDTGRLNRIEGGREYMVPSTAQGAFRISGPPGHDVIYWMMSPVELGEKEPAKYKPLPPPPPSTPEVRKSLVPRCDETILRARGDCVDGSAGPKAVKPGQPLPKNLAGIPGATSRELFFLREREKAVVSSPQPLGGPVIYEFRLAHK